MRRHGGVLPDGIGDAFILKKNREALQGRPEFAKGAQSATNCHSYRYTLARRAVVASFDLSAKNLNAFKADHWLSNPAERHPAAPYGQCGGRRGSARSSLAN